MSKLLKSELTLRGSDNQLHADTVICCCHYKQVPRFGCRTGKVWLGTQFIEVPHFETELTYSEDGKLVEEVEIASIKKRPIGRWAKGWICPEGQLDYRTITHTRKNGEEWWEPRVQLDDIKVWTTNKQGKRVLKPSHSVSLNPGWTGATDTDDSNLVDPPGDLVEIATKDDIDGKCYQKFARGR
jgi:hypothetical protein